MPKLYEKILALLIQAAAGRPSDIAQNISRKITPENMGQMIGIVERHGLSREAVVGVCRALDLQDELHDVM